MVSRGLAEPPGKGCVPQRADLGAYGCLGEASWATTLEDGLGAGLSEQEQR